MFEFLQTGVEIGDLLGAGRARHGTIGLAHARLDVSL
jgi:hypothetical protein